MPFFRSNFNASADDVVSLAGDSVLAGQSVLSSDTKKPYKNETLLTIVLTGGTVADLVADGLIAQPDTSVTDIEQYILAVGDIKTDVAVSANAGTLSINASAGTFTYLDTVANPDDIQQTTYTVQSPVTFDLYKQDGLISAGQTLVPVTEYDNNGVVTTITAANDATIHELWANPQVANTFILVMGQTNYTTLNSASDDVAAYTPLLPAAVSGWVRVCRIAARRDTTDLAVSNRAEFHNADKFGQAASVAVVAAMTGATALLDGTQGSAPAPTAGQERRFLRGDATFAEAVEHVFVSDTAMAPATAGTPTLGEVTAAIATLLKNGCLAYYTGDDIATNTPTYIWHVNEAGDARVLRGGQPLVRPQELTITTRDALTGVINGDLVTTAVPPVTWLRVSGVWTVWDSSEALAPVDVIDATTGIPDNQITPLTTGMMFRVQNTAGGTPADTIIGFPAAGITQADELYIELSNTGGGTLNAVFNAVYKSSDGTADIGTIAYNTSTDPKSFIFRRKTIAGVGLDEYWLVGGTELPAGGATIFDRVVDITARDALTGMSLGDIVATIIPQITWRYDGAAWQFWDSSEAKTAVLSYADVDIPDDELNPFTTGPSISLAMTTTGQTRQVGFPSASFNQSDALYIEATNIAAFTTNLVFDPVYKDASGVAIGTKVFTSTGIETISYIFRRKIIAVAGSDEYWLVGGTEYVASASSIALHQAKLEASAAIATVSGDNTLILDSEVFDTGGIANPGTGLMTILQAGRYLIIGHAGNTVASNNTQVFINVNGVKVVRDVNSQAGSGNQDVQTTTTVLDLGIGDTVQLGVFTNGADATGTGADAPFLTVLQQPTTESIPTNQITVATLSRLQVALSGTVNDAASTHYGFDTTKFTAGTELSLSGTGSIDGLQAGKTYKLDANMFSPGGTTGGIILRFVDLTTGAAQIGEQWEFHSANDGNSASDQAGQIAFFTPAVTTSVGVDYVGGSKGELGANSTFTVEEVAVKSVISTTDTPYAASTGANYTAIEIGAYRDLTFEISSTDDNDEAVVFPIAFSAAPNTWDVQISGRADSGNGGSGGSLVTGSLTATGLSINRLDAVQNADNAFNIIRVRGLI